MKKVFCIQIILLAFVLLMVGCVPVETEPVETEPPEIELTLENYSEYLSIKTRTSDTLYWDGACLGKAYYYTYCLSPGKFKNVEIRLKLKPKVPYGEFVTSVGVYKDEIDTSFELPADGEYTSDEYELFQVDLFDDTIGMYPSVVSISGTFIPD